MRVITIFLIVGIIAFASVNVKSQENHHFISIYFESDFDKTNVNQVDSILKTNDWAATDSRHLIGFCDSDGSIVYNENLSQRRINFIELQLRKYAPSVAKISIIPIAKGELNPIYPNDNELNKAKNRRVDIVIYKRKLSESLNQLKPDSVLLKHVDLISSESIKKSNMTVEILNQKIEESLKTGDNIELNDILFRPGLDVFQPYSMQTLEVLYNVLSARRDLKIEIQGHVCCVSENQYDGKNYRSGSNNLSEDRAEAVKEYLVNLGINPRNIQTKGFGGSRRKVFPELTEEDKSRNRRVEIKLLK
jgi:outer membrane protein OmpA-like peptidoglycan-associated protein